MFGFLFLAFSLTTMLCAQITIALTYRLLCAENYRWQWRAFNGAGAGAAWVLVYALLYWLVYLRFASATGVLLYVGYSALIAFLFYVLMGTVGFFASWMFTRRIYREIRVD